MTENATIETQETFGDYDDTIEQDEFEWVDHETVEQSEAEQAAVTPNHDLIIDTNQKGNYSLLSKFEAGDHVEWTGVASPDGHATVENTDDSIVTLSFNGETYRLFPQPGTNSVMFSTPNGDWMPVKRLWIVARGDHEETDDTSD